MLEASEPNALKYKDFFNRSFPRPILFCSRCITFEAVRYSGEIISSDEVESLKPYADFITACPEVDIGMGIPRDTVRIVSVNGENRLIQPKTGIDFTQKMVEYARRRLTELEQCDGFIFKSKSPSSGLAKIPIYKAIDDPNYHETTRGIFAGIVYEKYSYKPMIEEGPLKNNVIWEHFLTKIYLWAEFRLLMQSFSMRSVVEFQTKNKLLLMALNPTQLKELGNIVANHNHLPENQVKTTYSETFKAIMQNEFTYKKHVNVLEHIYGYFKENIAENEKKFFLQEFELYRAGILPLTVLIHLLREFTIRFNQEYIKDQTHLQPFPDALAFKGEFYSNKERLEREEWYNKKLANQRES